MKLIEYEQLKRFLNKLRTEFTNSINSAIAIINKYTINGHLIKDNPVLTKADVGLGNVINEEQIPLSQKGVEIATLGSDGKLTASQLPALKTINNESVVGSGNITIDLSLYKLVTTLPTQNIDSNKIYLVKNSESESQNTYSEYIYLTESSTWEKLGTYKSDVDLSPYVKFTDVESQLSATSTKPVQNKIINSALSGKSDVGHKHNISDINNLQTTLDGKSSTSHTHADFKGASNSAKGTAGFVPAPAIGDNSSKYLKADGTWATPPNTTYTNVTSSKDGLMTKEDKIKLDGIQEGANKTVVDSILSSESINPVQNKILNSALEGKANKTHNHNSSYVQAVALNGNYLRVTKNGANTDITIPYATKANQLNTTRTIWGQNFNGTANVTGSLRGVSQITASGGLSTDWDDTWNDGTYDHPWYGLDLRNNYEGAGSPYCQTLSGYFGMCFKTSRGLMSILYDGNVGIGTAAPSTKLDVNGTIKGTTLQGNLAWSYITGAPTVFKGATSSAAGSTGLVPAPAAGAQAKYLRADGTWQTPPDTNTTYGLATTSANGLLRQLNGNASYYLNGAGNWSVPPTYTHPSYINAGEGLYKITVQNGHVIKVTGVTKSDITALGIPGQDTNTTYNIATASVAGLVKPVSVITKPALQPVTTTGGRYYQVQMSSDGNMFVNVPWTAGSSITVDSGLSSTSTNPVQNKVIYNALAGKADSNHNHNSSYVSSVNISGNYLVVNKNGVNTNITVPYASNADKLDGLQLASLVRCDLGKTAPFDWNDLTTPGYYKIQWTNDMADVIENHPSGEYQFGVAEVIGMKQSADPGEKRLVQLYFPHNSRNNHPIWVRVHNSSSYDSGWNSWMAIPSTAGNIATASKLQTARTINGTSFDGSANITTAKWGTSRNLTIGGATKAVDGSANVTWSLSEIGAASSAHTHNYLPLTGGTLTGGLICNKSGENSLQVTGQSMFTDKVSIDDELWVKVNITCNDQITAAAFYESSDRSLKENIKPISNSDLEKVKNIEFKEFNFKENSTKKYGVIAQEVEDAKLNNLVSENSEGVKSVDYISLLVLKIQQLEEEIKELKYGKQDSNLEVCR